MSASAVAVSGYITLMLVLVVLIGIIRTLEVINKGRAPNNFKPDGSDVSAFSHRLARAHANCYESFPIVGGILLLALAIGQAPITDALAPWAIAERLAQTMTHLISTRSMAVQIRFFFFTVQLVIVAWWIIRLLLLGAAS